MEEDTNQDLIGYRFVDDRGRLLEVTGSTSWSPNYVEVVDTDSESRWCSVRPAGIVRRSREVAYLASA